MLGEDIVRLKERINAAFDVLMRLHEETINRDSVLAELLLETQMGKNQRLICRLNTNEKLQVFFETLQEDFTPPDIHLTTAVLPHRYGSDSLGGTRKSSKHSRKSSCKKQRSRSHARPYATEVSQKKCRVFDNEDVDVVQETEL